MKRSTLVLAVILIVLCTGGYAAADLVGSNVTVQWVFPDAGTVFKADTVLVGAGPEIVCPGLANVCDGFIDSNQSFDLTGNSITFSMTDTFPITFDPKPFNGFNFSGLSAGLGSLTGYLLVTDLAGLDASRVSFDADSIRINLSGLVVDGSNYFTLELQSGAPGGPVPEPMSLLMVGSGLFALAGSLRRKLF